MKIRHGFVSNSSSTSFAVMTTKKNYERAIEAVHPHVAAYMKHRNWAWGKGKFQGVDVLIFCEEVNTEDGCDMEYIGYTGELIESQHFCDGTPAMAEELINTFIEELEKSPDEVAWNAGGH